MIVDFVFPYVDNTRKQWREQYVNYCKSTHQQNLLYRIDGERYFDLGLLRYIFRGIDKFMPFIRKVHLIVSHEDQVPAWVDRTKVNIVTHEMIIPKEYLPTYNSTTIEMFLHNIPDLAEHFIYSNDDIYFTAKAKESDYFNAAGLPLIKIEGKPITEEMNLFNKVCYKNYSTLCTKLGLPINSHYYLTGGHEIFPMLKSSCKEVYELLKDEIHKSLSAFRTPTNFNQYLYSLYNYFCKRCGESHRTFDYHSLLESISSLVECMQGQNQVVCLNDTGGGNREILFEQKGYFVKAFNKLGLNSKSQYELNNEKETYTLSLHKIIGIISWFPDSEPVRTERQNALKRLVDQLAKIFPDIPLMIIAQNWKDFKLETKQTKYLYLYNKLGILQARKALRKHFLESKNDYLIMFDDDAVLQVDDPEAPAKYLAAIDKNPFGFCFIADPENPQEYKASQLNLCAISKYIMTAEDFPNVDPQKHQGFEDLVYSTLLHCKYSKYEFQAPSKIYHIHYRNKQITTPTTWHDASVSRDFQYMVIHSRQIVEYIKAKKELPPENFLSQGPPASFQMNYGNN